MSREFWHWARVAGVETRCFVAVVIVASWRTVQSAAANRCEARRVLAVETGNGLQESSRVIDESEDAVIPPSTSHEPVGHSRRRGPLHSLLKFNCHRRVAAGLDRVAE